MPGAVVVGTGFGCRVHVPALRTAGFTVHALVGQDADAHRDAAPNGSGSRTRARRSPPRSSSTDVDAVTIATPPDTHAPLAIEACAAGRHVVCEKPFALDAAEAERMLDAAERAGVTHLVGHEFRWSPDRALVARAIADGVIGEPRLFSLVSFVPLVADPDSARFHSWWFDGPRGGGWLGASGSHIVDQLRTWVGEIASVERDAADGERPGRRRRGQLRRAPDDSRRRGRRDPTDGRLVGAGRHRQTVIAGTEGTIEVTGDGVFCSDRNGRRELPVPADLALPAPPDALGRSAASATRTWSSARTPGWPRRSAQGSRVGRRRGGAAPDLRRRRRGDAGDRRDPGFRRGGWRQSSVVDGRSG